MAPQAGATGPTTTMVTIDHVDFIRWSGRQYLAGSFDAEQITDADLGQVAGSSRCSLSDLNARTGQEPPGPVDGDTGFLPAGTSVYAVRGWSAECRLAAAHGGELRVYLAPEQGGTHARPSACALRS
jgi:hypothetical protein